LNDIPIGPPTVATVGEVNDAATFPFAKFTLTGPAESVGAGPALVIRKLTVKWLTHPQ
jgi:hypothetical protein